MAQPHSIEVLLRPAVELYTVAVCVGAALLCLVAPWSLALSPLLGLGSALAFLTFGVIRWRDAWAILRYRRNIRRLPRYVMTSRDVPVSQQRLFVGRGFRWDQRHTHRLVQTYRPEFRRYVEPTAIYRAARRIGKSLFPCPNAGMPSTVTPSRTAISNTQRSDLRSIRSPSPKPPSHSSMTAKISRGPSHISAGTVKAPPRRGA